MRNQPSAAAAGAKQELYNRAKQLGVQGPLEEEQEGAGTGDPQTQLKPAAGNPG
ncbi:MAG TPA: hypothetical protein VMT16_10265 [Thermoanaerobaculia bacterium]|nr:hypothetical protein [Thermoanaerobaculia bacterium]